MNKPLASCVCVTYNRPHLLNELLYCFLQQDYDNKELIILNDQADKKYVYDDPRVHIYNLDERFPSLGAKREYSRNLTKGDFIFIMDDDDIYYSRHISNLLKFHLDHLTFDIVYVKQGDYTVSNENISNVDTKVAFNGASIYKKYWKNNSFLNNISNGEDQYYIQNAKICHIDGEATFHYRWGLDIHHISGLGGDGMESYNIVTNNTPIGETRIIELKPEISEKVKLYYR